MSYWDENAADLGIDPAWAQGGFTGGAQGVPGFAGGSYDPATGKPITAPTQGQTAGQGAPSGPQQQQTPYGGNYEGDWGSFIGGKGNLGYGAIRNNLPQYAEEFNQLHPGANIKATGRPGDYDTIQLPSGQIVDVQTAAGQNWWGPEGPGGGGGSSGGGGGFGGGLGGYGGGRDTSGITLPTAPQAQNLTAPSPFTYQPSTLGEFKANSQTPTMERLGYNPMATPGSLTPAMQATQGGGTAPDQQRYGGGGAMVGGDPAQLVGGTSSSSNRGDGTWSSAMGGSSLGNPSGGGGATMGSSDPGMTPRGPQTGQSNEAAGYDQGAWNALSPAQRAQYQQQGGAPGQQQAGGNQPGPPQAPTVGGNLQQLSYQGIATPQAFQAERYNGLSADQLASDPSYKFRFDQGQQATENALAHSGALRTGNALQALTNYGQGAASQEYAAADARARNTVGQNNASSLGAYNANAQTGLAYNQANNQGQMAATQGNISNQFNATNANNAANLAFGNQNFNQQFATNQANNQGQFQATQANNQNALAQQGQQFGQGLAGYQANQAAQQQGYNQALGAYGMNAQTQLGYGSQNQQNQLANYQAQTNAALGLGNLNLGYQNSAQNYALGQGGLGLQQQGQQWGQGLDVYDRNYRANVTDPWQQQYQLASLGNPGAPNTQGNANAQGDLYTQQGNANAAGTVGSANAWNQAAGQIGNTAMGGYAEWLRSQRGY